VLAADESIKEVVETAGVERSLLAVFLTDEPKEEMVSPCVNLVVVTETENELAGLRIELMNTKEEPDVLEVAKPFDT
jgi:hypothetical protein